jgi:SAM-dependent methyltransferase
MVRARRTGTFALLLFVGAACTPAAPPPSASSAPSGSAPETRAAPSTSAVAQVDAGAALDAGAPAAGGIDIIYVPTPQKVVDKMLELAKVTKNDVVYDLGCGDGRIVVSAAKKMGARGIGFDLDPDRVTEARANVDHAGVGALTQIKQENVFSVDLSPATVVMLYLLPELNVRLIPQLEKLRPGSRIVSHDFDMEGVTPDVHLTMMAPEFVDDEGYSAYRGPTIPEDKKNYKERKHDLYLWTIPLHKSPPRAAAAGAGADAGKMDRRAP